MIDVLVHYTVAVGGIGEYHQHKLLKVKELQTKITETTDCAIQVPLNQDISVVEALCSSKEFKSIQTFISENCLTTYYIIETVLTHGDKTIFAGLFDNFVSSQNNIRVQNTDDQINLEFNIYEKPTL